MTTKRKLKGFVLPTIYLFAVLTIFLTVNIMVKVLNKGKGLDYDYVISAFKKNAISVISAGEENIIIKPINNENIGISKYFYEISDNEDRQEKSLIYYENTYMENTGVLYTADEEFETVAVLDGTVKEITEDELLKTVVKIEHSTELTTMYYSLSRVNLKVGDKITQGTVIGKSGANKLEKEKSNCLLFEVYYKGNLLNPEKFYAMNLKDLQ